MSHVKSARQSNASVGTGSGLILPDSAWRRSRVVVGNYGGKDAWLGLGEAAVVGEGIYVKAGTTDGVSIEGWNGEIHAIADTPGTTLAISQQFLDRIPQEAEVELDSFSSSSSSSSESSTSSGSTEGLESSASSPSSSSSTESSSSSSTESSSSSTESSSSSSTESSETSSTESSESSGSSQS